MKQDKTVGSRVCVVLSQASVFYISVNSVSRKSLSEISVFHSVLLHTSTLHSYSHVLFLKDSFDLCAVQ